MNSVSRPSATLTHLSLHRCRFVDFPPSEIAALAFSHPSNPSSTAKPPPSLRLAIGRENGSIEIWNPLGGRWHYELTIPGGEGRHIGALAWTVEDADAGLSGLRLFSIGYSTEVTEWDLTTGKPKRHVDCHGGALWSIAVQPPAANVDSDDEEQPAQKIVVGTDDGTVKILSTDGGDLAFDRNLMRAGPTKARVLALAWKDRNTVVAGMADSMLRVWDIRSGRSIAKMSMGRERKRDILVWALKVTKNGEIVTGDSRGEISFWDGGNYTLKQRIKAHEADVLALEVGGKNGEYVMSGSADMRTSMFRTTGKGGRWAEVAHRRAHKHDVRAIAAFESGPFSMVVTGGVDMTPVTTSFKSFATDRHINLPLVPQKPIVSTLPEHRMLMSFWEREVKIWRVDELAESNPDVLEDDETQGRTLLSRILLSNEEYIMSASLAAIPENAGFLLAVATSGEIKLFHLRSRRSSNSTLRVNKLPMTTVPYEEIDSDDDSSDDSSQDELDFTSTGARILSFSPNGNNLLIVTPDSEVFVLTPSTSKLVQLPVPIATNPESSINCASISNTHIALSTLAGDIYTFAFDPITQIPSKLPSLPRLSSAPALLSLRPNTDDLLVMPSDSRHLHLFNMATGRLSDWSRDNPNPPPAFKMVNSYDQPINNYWESNGDRVWVHGANWVWMFDFSRNWPDSLAHQHQQEVYKRRRDGELITGPASSSSAAAAPQDESMALQRAQPMLRKERGQKPFWGSLRYKGLLAFLPLGMGEMVRVAPEGEDEEVEGKEYEMVRAVEVAVVERPVWDAHKSLPPRFFDGRK